MVEQINGNLVAKQVKIRLAPDASKYILEKTCGDRSYGARRCARVAEIHRGSALRIADPGHAAAASELEVYLGDTGIYYRQLSGEAEAAVVTAGGRRSRAGTLLYTF